MKFRWLQTILVILAAAGWAAAQGPAQGPAHSTSVYGPPQGFVAPLPEGSAADPSCEGGMPLADDEHPLYSVYGFGQALFWNIRDASLPSIVNNVPVGVATVTLPTGAVGTVPVSIISNPQVPGADRIDTSNHFGVRAGGGIWFGDSRSWGLEFSGFALEEQTQRFNLNNTTSPQALNITAIFTPPGATPITITIPRQAVVSTSGTFSSSLWGAEANVMRKGWYYGPLLWSYLTGVRYQEFEEEATLNNSVSFTPQANAAAVAGFPTPLSFTTFDRVRTRNQFFGAQIGLEADLVYGRFFFNTRGKVALGDVRQNVNLFGMTTVVNGPGVTMAPGGVLTGPGQGSFSRDKVGFLPEVNFKAGYQICDGVRIYLGYDALYMQHVLRPGNQSELATLNTQVMVNNTNTAVTVQQPVTRLKDMDVWVQGLNAGFEIRY